MSESISAASKTLRMNKLFDVRKLAAFTKAKKRNLLHPLWMDGKTRGRSAEKGAGRGSGYFLHTGRNPDRRVSIPPTRLKTPKLIKPFEMFIQMYGLPNYQEFDPGHCSWRCPIRLSSVQCSVMRDRVWCC